MRNKNDVSADLVIMAGWLHPIPFRTRPRNAPAPMVLRLKTRESRSLPGLQRRHLNFASSATAGPRNGSRNAQPNKSINPLCISMHKRADWASSQRRVFVFG